MNWFIISSGALAALTAGVHLSLGGVTIARRLLASSLEDEVKFTMYACWHLVSVILVLSAFALLATGVGMMALNSSLIAFISLSWLLFGFVFLTVTLLLLGLTLPAKLDRQSNSKTEWCKLEQSEKPYELRRSWIWQERP